MITSSRISRRRAGVICALVVGVSTLLLAYKLTRRDAHAPVAAAVVRQRFTPQVVLSSSQVAQQLAGVVSTEQGQPITGASLTLWRTPTKEPGNYHTLPPRRFASSGQQGSFAFQNVSKGEYCLAASAPGYAPVYLPHVTVGDDSAQVTVTLRPGGYLVHGIVRDIGAGVIAGAVVSVMKLLEGESLPVVQDVITDGDGLFAVSLAAGRYVLTAKAGGYATNSRELIVQKPTETELILLAGGTISGRVSSGLTHEPAATAEVALISPPGIPAPLPVASNGEGAFLFDSLEPGIYRAWARQGSWVSGEVLVNVACGNVSSDVELALRPGATVTGRVVDSTERPLAGVQISVRSSFIKTDRSISGTTAADGTFQIGGIIPGSVSLVASGVGLVSGAVNLDAREGPNRVKDIVLGAGATLRGVVEGNRPFEQLPVLTLSLGSGSAAIAKKTTAGENGEFSFPDIPGNLGGSIQAVAQGVGYARLDVAPLSPGQARDVVVRLETAGSWISGTVRREDGGAVSEAVIVGAQYDTSGAQRTFNVVAGPDGAYRLGPFQKGKVALYGYPPGTFGSAATPSLSIDLEENETRTPVDIAVSEEKGVLSGTVVDEGAHPVSGAVIVAAAGDHGPSALALRASLRTESQLDGSFRLPVVGRGPFTLWARHADYGDAHLLGATTRDPITVRLETGGRIVGTLSDEHGPVSSYELTVVRNPATPPSDQSGPVFTSVLPLQRIFDERGQFEVRGLSRGYYFLRFRSAGTTIATTNVDLRDSTTLPAPLNIVARNATEGGAVASANAHAGSPQ